MSGIIKATKKPVQIEAIQWTGNNIKDIESFCKDSILGSRCYLHDESNNGTYVLKIRTLEGDHKALIGDFIIKGVQGEYYPCKEDIFNLTYDINI